MYTCFDMIIPLLLLFHDKIVQQYLNEFWKFTYLILWGVTIKSKIPVEHFSAL